MVYLNKEFDIAPKKKHEKKKKTHAFPDNHENILSQQTESIKIICFEYIIGISVCDVMKKKKPSLLHQTRKKKRKKRTLSPFPSCFEKDGFENFFLNKRKSNKDFISLGDAVDVDNVNAKTK